MATAIRAEISESNKYWIDKHRHYELKHFCLQYPNWKRTYTDFYETGVPVSNADRIRLGNLPGDPTGNAAVRRAYYKERIELIERAAEDADEELKDYILKAVTEGLSYTQLKSKFNIPCGRDMYYDRYRRFFWILNKERG